MMNLSKYGVVLLRPTLNDHDNPEKTQLGQALMPSDDEILFADGTEIDHIGTSEHLSDEESQSIDNRKRKSVNPVPRLIDNKRKHLEKTLSAAQRDALLLTEAKEESKFRKDPADATREATSCFSTALKDLSNSMTQVGNGLSRPIEMMAQAVMAQTMNNSQARPVPINQNLFYQNVPNVYSAPTSHQLNTHAMQSNVHQQSGTAQPNLIQQGHQSNEGHGEETIYHQL